MGRMNTVKENKRQTTYVHVWGESEKALQSKDDKASAIVDYGWKVCRNPLFQFYVCNSARKSWGRNKTE